MLEKQKSQESPAQFPFAPWNIYSLLSNMRWSSQLPVFSISWLAMVSLCFLKVQNALFICISLKNLLQMLSFHEI